jgi:anti-sigma B factor antagonist
VRSERSGRLHVLTPTGDLDIATAAILENAFDAVSTADPNLVIALDLTELTFMDSTGLHLLLRLTERLPRRLRVINGSPAVERLLDLSGARDRLPIISPTTDPLDPLR